MYGQLIIGLECKTHHRNPLSKVPFTYHTASQNLPAYQKCQTTAYDTDVKLGWKGNVFWILDQPVLRISSCPCMSHVHSPETQIANGLSKINDKFLSFKVHACARPLPPWATFDSAKTDIYIRFLSSSTTSFFYISTMYYIC